MKMMFWIKQQGYYRVFYGIDTVYSKIAYFINIVQTIFSLLEVGINTYRTNVENRVSS